MAEPNSKFKLGDFVLICRNAFMYHEPNEPKTLHCLLDRQHALIVAVGGYHDAWLRVLTSSGDVGWIRDDEIETEIEPQTPVVVPKVGQLWSWNFPIGEGWWPLQQVTELAYHQPLIAPIVQILRGDIFTVVKVDDPGPAQLPIPGAYVEIDIPDTYFEASIRWSVILLNGLFCWFQYSYFEQATLMGDVRSSVSV